MCLLYKQGGITIPGAFIPKLCVFVNVLNKILFNYIGDLTMGLTYKRPYLDLT